MFIYSSLPNISCSTKECGKCSVGGSSNWKELAESVISHGTCKVSSMYVGTSVCYLHDYPSIMETKIVSVHV